MCSLSVPQEAASKKAEDLPLEDPISQRLFRLFLLFSDSEQKLSAEQAQFLVNEFFRISIPTQRSQNIPSLIQSKSISFGDFVQLCDLLFPDRLRLGPLVDRLFERFVSQVIFKGFVMCRRVERLKSCMWKSRKWRLYWCTAHPGAVYLWPLHKPTTLANRRKIALDASATVNAVAFEDERFTWNLRCSGGKEFLFGHFDEIQRSSWITDIQLAIAYRTKNDLLEYDRKRARETENLYSSEKNLTWRLALESENLRLMKLLDEERKALHDEEIVRTLAARMFDEEREKRERLEKKLSDMEYSLKRNRSLENGIEENIRRQLREVRRQQLHASTKSL